MSDIHTLVGVVVYMSGRTIRLVHDSVVLLALASRECLDKPRQTGSLVKAFDFRVPKDGSRQRIRPQLRLLVLLEMPAWCSKVCFAHMR